MRLQDKVAIITGAASGIGQATAQRFSEEGAIVIIADLPNSNGEEVAWTIQDAGGRAQFIPTDVTRSEQISELVDNTVKNFNKIDIMYNNAGIAMPISSIEDISEDHYERMMDINMKGIFLGTKAVVPYMKEAKQGVILSTGSTSALRPRAGLNIYCASKGAVVAFMKSMALELAPHGIRVNSINPVATNTPMVDEEQRKKFIGTIPLGRLAKPTDMANTALFLASDEAAMITGVDLEVDGGRCV
ncbi:short chain dehydrogenase [Pueribacillus theae]|uniref:Short chain dehydrogenase n=1 Tax=Pueribacillus theae TaxID=2171751 RepID=A0A2U1K3S2_9BACI|nr:SDR family oxidoreductase [Pueribacillus theae]PWA12161.1 short chain dehydrogenase [Pueribacillus theae]